MFPKLSEKGWQDLRKLDPNCGALAFMAMFDLKTFPVTWQQLIDYAKKNEVEVKGDTFIVRHYDSDGASDINEYSEEDGIYYSLYGLQTAMPRLVDTTTIIGEIYGWWEEGDNHVS